MGRVRGESDEYLISRSVTRFEDGGMGDETFANAELGEKKLTCAASGGRIFLVRGSIQAAFYYH